MSTVEKMNTYIQRSNVEETVRYVMTVKEMQALWSMVSAGKIFEALDLAFEYGRAKGCRMARTTVRQ